MAAIWVDEGWVPFSFIDPRCPYCGGEMVITESEVEATDAGMESGWVAVYCVGHPEEHLDNCLKFCRPTEEML